MSAPCKLMNVNTIAITLWDHILVAVMMDTVLIGMDYNAMVKINNIIVRIASAYTMCPIMYPILFKILMNALYNWMSVSKSVSISMDRTHVNVMKDMQLSATDTTLVRVSQN